MEQLNWVITIQLLHNGLSIINLMVLNTETLNIDLYPKCKKYDKNIWMNEIYWIKENKKIHCKQNFEDIYKDAWLLYICRFGHYDRYGNYALTFSSIYARVEPSHREDFPEAISATDHSTH